MKKNIEKIKGIISRFRGLATVGASQITANAISGLFWLYMARLLGTENYGYVSYFIAIAGITAVIATLGAQNALTVYTAKGVKIQSTLFLTSLFANVTSSVILFFIFYNSAVSLFALGNTIFGLILAELIGRKLYGTWGKYLVTQKILSVVFAIGLYYMMGPNGVILGIALSFLPSTIRMYKIFREISVDFLLVKTRLKFMMNSYLLDLSRSFNVSIDKLIVAPLLGLSMLGNYQLAIQILSVTGMFPVILFQYLLPQDASGNSNSSLKKVSIFISIILTVLAILLAPVLLPILFPKYQDAITVVQITSLNIVPSTITLSYVSKFFGAEKNKIVLIGSLIYLAIEVPFTILLGKSYGVNGVGIAMVLATSIECIYLILVNRFISRESSKDSLKI